jgi:Tfp pilus assembly protein PilN
MSVPSPIPVANFSRDLRRLSLAVALAIAGLSLAGLVTTVIFLEEWSDYRDTAAYSVKQITAVAAEATSLRSQRTNEPDAVAVNALRKRIASLNALDFGAAPSVARVLAVLEQLMPAGVALQSLDYDRGRATLELVAVSESSDDLTAFFDITSRTSFFKSVRLVDKKQAGTTESQAQLFQVRLSMRFLSAEPRS